MKNNISKLRALFCIAFVVIFCGSLFLSTIFSDKASGNTKIKNFRQSKRYLRVIWDENPKTFYCGASYDKKGFITNNNGYTSKKYIKRSKRREWEHIVPASRIGAKINKITC